MKVEAILTSVY